MSDHGARALLLAAVSLVVVAALLWGWAGRPSGVEEIAEAAAAAPAGALVRIDDVVERDWAALHVFAPYTPPEVVEAAVGRRVGEVRGLVRDEVMLLVLSDAGGRVIASGLVPRMPVDWLPAAREEPYAPHEAVFRVVDGDTGRELQPAGSSR